MGRPGGGLAGVVLGRGRLKAPAPVALALDQALPLAEAARLSGVAPARAELKTTPRGPAWVLTPLEGAPVTVAAATGRSFAAMREDEASALAAAAYRGGAAPRQAVLLDQAPKETGREGPIWRVEFNDAERTAFYLSPQTGDVVTRRSAVWRFYDFFWRLHILDFKDGDNFNHPLLIGLTALTLSIVITGFILLWIRLARDLKTARAVRAARRKAAL
ncbi:PepSY domain-containing protein [Brevundimonas sanguinis]|uniref:PepSY domain-containing protein n=1 Tax=Brevundimonas sanguinis TaxID=3021811 RepID=UPI0024158A4F|nr:PepSY domain-containing protein [Brevundimonas sp. NCCP 15609]